MSSILNYILGALLFPFSLIYNIVTSIRNYLYDSGKYRSVKFDVPTICVGNLSVGGTGKSPHIEYLIQLLKDEFQVATLSRGYKRKTKGFYYNEAGVDAAILGDEPMQFHVKHPDITVAVCEDRLTGIPAVLRMAPQTQVILLDDAYQHRSVRPGLNIMISDYHHPFYEDYVLPLGRLREARKGYKRADIIIISKCPADLNAAEQEKIIQKVNPLAHQSVYFTTIAYGNVYDLFTQQSINIEGSNTLIVSGIAKPTLMQTQIETQASSSKILKYPDHHFFTDKDIQDIIKTYQAWNVDDKMIITTEKDATRLLIWKKMLQEHQIKIGVLPIKMQFLTQNIDFNHRIKDFIHSEINNNI